MLLLVWLEELHQVLWGHSDASVAHTDLNERRLGVDANESASSLLAIRALSRV